MIRTLFAVVASFAAVSATAVLLIAGGQQGNVERPWADRNAYLQCSRACDDCARVCDACGVYCAQLVATGKKEYLQTSQSCQDCAAVCRAASGVAARHKPFSGLIGAACAEACGLCADSCERFQDDLMMQRCAEECRSCAKACRNMLSDGGLG